MLKEMNVRFFIEHLADKKNIYFMRKVSIESKDATRIYFEPTTLANITSFDDIILTTVKSASRVELSNSGDKSSLIARIIGTGVTASTLALYMDLGSLQSLADDLMLEFDDPEFKDDFCALLQLYAEDWLLQRRILDERGRPLIHEEEQRKLFTSLIKNGSSFTEAILSR